MTTFRVNKARNGLGPDYRLDQVVTENSEGRICEEDGCKRRTSEKKPYCLEHLDRLPGARALLDDIAAREQEERALLSGQFPDGALARDLLNYAQLWPIKGGIEAVAVLLYISVPAADCLVRELAARGLVKVRPTSKTVWIEREAA